MKAKIYRTLVAVFLLLISGCAIEHSKKMDARLALPPIANQLPLRIGVYYSPEFIEYTPKVGALEICERNRSDVPSKSNIFILIFPVGSSSRDLFDQMASSMFTTVIRTAGPSQSSGHLSLDGVLEPRIESFEWYAMCEEIKKDPNKLLKNAARVSYIINLYNGPDGQLVSSMHVEGRSIEKPKDVFFHIKDSLAAEQAMQEAMARFMIDFYERPEVKQWIATRVLVSGDH
jgi:hypothetical protein